MKWFYNDLPCFRAVKPVRDFRSESGFHLKTIKNKGETTENHSVKHTLTRWKQFTSNVTDRVRRWNLTNRNSFGRSKFVSTYAIADILIFPIYSIVHRSVMFFKVMLFKIRRTCGLCNFVRFNRVIFREFSRTVYVYGVYRGMFIYFIYSFIFIQLTPGGSCIEI